MQGVDIRERFIAECESEGAKVPKDVRRLGAWGTLRRVLFDGDAVREKLNQPHLLKADRLPRERSVHPVGFWARCAWEPGVEALEYDMPESCAAIVRLSTGMGGRSNSVAAIALKLFLDQDVSTATANPGENFSTEKDSWEGKRVLDVLTNSVNPTQEVDFHAPFRTNVYFRRSLPLSSAIAQAIFVDSFGRTGFDPEVFDLSHLSQSEKDSKVGTPETLFFRYVGEADLVSNCRAGDVFDVHVGDGTCMGLKIGRIRFEEDVRASDRYDATIAFSHKLRPKSPRNCCSASRLASYIGDTCEVLWDRLRRSILPTDPSLSHRLYVWAYDVTRNRNPSAQEALPPITPRAPKGLLNVEGFDLPIPPEASDFATSVRNSLLRAINSLPWNRECENDHPSTEACQVSTNPFLVLANLEQFLLDGPGLILLEPVREPESAETDLQIRQHAETWRADLSYLCDFAVRPGYKRYGCVLETDGTRLKRILLPVFESSSPGGKIAVSRWKSLPPEDLYALRVAWASLVVHATVSQHLGLDHLRIAGPFAEFVEGTHLPGDSFTFVGKLASYGTFEINFLGAPVLLYPGGLFDRLFAFEHSEMLRLLSLPPHETCPFGNGGSRHIYDQNRLENLPQHNPLARCLLELRNGPYSELADKILQDSFDRRTPEIWSRLVRIVSESGEGGQFARNSPDENDGVGGSDTFRNQVREALKTTLMHVTVDHYLVGRLEKFVPMAGFRTTIWEMGAPTMSIAETELVNLTLRLTFNEGLDLADDLSAYFRQKPDLLDTWTSFQNHLRRILANPTRRIPLEDISIAVNI